MTTETLVSQQSSWVQPAASEIPSTTERSESSFSLREQRSSPIPKGHWSYYSDEQLMAACRNNQGAALEELYKRYNRKVFGFISRNIHRQEQVEDLVQEVFLRVYRQRKRYRENGRFTVWLYRIARNLCIDESRRHWNKFVSRETDIPSDFDRSGFIESIPGKDKGIRGLMDEERKSRILKKAMAELSEIQREIVILNKFQGLTYREISEVVGGTPESIKQHAHRAFLRLRDLLAPSREELTQDVEMV